MIKQSVRGEHLRASIALFFGILCIGFAAVFVKIANVPGSVTAFYRVLVASIVIGPWALTQSKVRPTRNDVIVVSLGGIIFSLTLALWNKSVLLTSAATATLLVNSAPLWVGLASYILFRERLSKSYWMGLAIAMVGMMWLIGAEAYEQLHFNSGNLIALGASVTYAAYLLITQKIRARVDLLTFMAISLTSGVVTLFVFNLAIGTKLTGYPSRVWMALVGLGLVSQLGGWLGINYALGHIRAAQVSVWLLSESVATGIVAMIFLQEYLHLNQIIGGALILFGIYFVTRQSSKAPILPKKSNKFKRKKTA